MRAVEYMNVLRSAGRGGAWAAAWIRSMLAAERGRAVLWLPVSFGAGIGLYFALGDEPPWWAAPAVLGLAVTVGAAGRASAGVVAAAIGCAAMALGAIHVQWRTQAVGAPVLERRLPAADIAARVVAVERRADDARRLTLDRLTIPGLAADKTPVRARVRARGLPPELAPGDRISLRAVLLPPPAPAAPGAYDFQRQAWFEGLGAVGYATGPVQRLSPGDAAAGWRVWMNALRTAVQDRILAAIPGPAGTIAAALITGEQGAVPEAAIAWMRDSGLAHLLSISGLHIAIVAGIVFFAVRGGLALIPRVALRRPIKKWAAVASFLAITFYMLFATESVPTQRSWLMTSLVLLAVLIDRTAISMRLVAWAAFAVLAIDPASLLGPSFQMSFAAVVALIAAFEVLREPVTRWRAERGLIGRGAVALFASGMTALVAGTASAPYALYHFNRFAAFGLAANLVAVPLTGLWVMPWAVVAVLLLPLGWEGVALTPMGWGVEGILAIAREVAGWGGAVALLPAMPAWGLAAVTFGGLWLCVWRAPWRLAGVPAIALGLAAIGFERGPDILIAGDARLVAVRDASGLLMLSAERRAPLTREAWLRRAGQEEAMTWPRSGPSGDGSVVCDPAGCAYTARGHVVALARDPSALDDDCRAATLVVATIPVRRSCPSARVVVDRFSLWRDGGHAVWLNDDGTVRVETVRAARGERPWVPPLPKPRDRAPPEAARESP